MAEIETQLIIGKEVGYISNDIQDEFLTIIDELTRMVKGLMNHLKGKICH